MIYLFVRDTRTNDTHPIALGNRPKLCRPMALDVQRAIPRPVTLDTKTTSALPEELSDMKPTIAHQVDPDIRLTTLYLVMIGAKPTTARLAKADMRLAIARQCALARSLATNLPLRLRIGVSIVQRTTLHIQPFPSVLMETCLV